MGGGGRVQAGREVSSREGQPERGDRKCEWDGPGFKFSPSRVLCVFGSFTVFQRLSFFILKMEQQVSSFQVRIKRGRCPVPGSGGFSENGLCFVPCYPGRSVAFLVAHQLCGHSLEWMISLNPKDWSRRGRWQ